MTTRETLTAYGASEIDRVVHEHRNGRTGAEHYSHVLNVLRQAARDRRTIEGIRKWLKIEVKSWRDEALLLVGDDEGLQISFARGAATGLEIALTQIAALEAADATPKVER